MQFYNRACTLSLSQFRSEPIINTEKNVKQILYLKWYGPTHIGFLNKHFFRLDQIIIENRPVIGFNDIETGVYIYAIFPEWKITPGSVDKILNDQINGPFHAYCTCPSGNIYRISSVGNDNRHAPCTIKCWFGYNSFCQAKQMAPVQGEILGMTMDE